MKNALLSVMMSLITFLLVQPAWASPPIEPAEHRPAGVDVDFSAGVDNILEEHQKFFFSASAGYYNSDAGAQGVGGDFKINKTYFVGEIVDNEDYHWGHGLRFDPGLYASAYGNLGKGGQLDAIDLYAEVWAPYGLRDIAYYSGTWDLSVLPMGFRYSDDQILHKKHLGYDLSLFDLYWGKPYGEVLEPEYEYMCVEILDEANAQPRVYRQRSLAVEECGGELNFKEVEVGPRPPDKHWFDFFLQLNGFRAVFGRNELMGEQSKIYLDWLEASAGFGVTIPKLGVLRDTVRVPWGMSAYKCRSRRGEVEDSASKNCIYSAYLAVRNRVSLEHIGGPKSPVGLYYQLNWEVINDRDLRPGTLRGANVQVRSIFRHNVGFAFSY